MEYSAQQKTILDKRFTLLAKRYLQAFDCNRYIGFRSKSRNKFHFGLLMLIFSYFSSSKILIVIFIIIGMLFIFKSIVMHNKYSKLLQIYERHIIKIEEEIFSKFKLIYCNCGKGPAHFFSPSLKKIWNSKSNVLLDTHETRRTTDLDIFGYDILDPFSKRSKGLSFKQK